MTSKNYIPVMVKRLWLRCVFASIDGINSHGPHLTS